MSIRGGPTGVPSATLSETEVELRLVRAQRSGRPAWLWPDVAPADWRDSLQRIEVATRALLSGEPSAPLTVGDAARRAALGVAAYTSGMGPLLGYWVETGQLITDDESGALLREHYAHGRARMTTLMRECELICEAAAAVNAAPVVLKGMHTAQVYFPDPGTRPSADIDLYVPPSRLAEFENVLRARDYVKDKVQHRPYKADWRARGARHLPVSLALTHADDPVVIDVHTSLDRNFFGVQQVHLEVAADARVLPQPTLALFLALHASEGLHNLRLIRLVELALVLRDDIANGALQWPMLLDCARERRALRFAYPAIELTERLIPGLIPQTVLAEFAAAATPAMKQIIASLQPATAQRLAEAPGGEQWMWAETGWEKTRLALHALWPAPAGRSVKRLSQIYVRRAWRLLDRVRAKRRSQ